MLGKNWIESKAITLLENTWAITFLKTTQKFEKQAPKWREQKIDRWQ